METGENENNPGGALRLLPSVDALMQTEAAQRLSGTAGLRHITMLARVVIEGLREGLKLGSLGAETGSSKESLLAEAERRLQAAWHSENNAGLRRVINATGVIIHTNLGRAPLSDAARAALFNHASGYCTLEYNIETGKRGKRGARAEHLLAELTGAESALIVNNCAAAAFLTLTVLAQGGETIISRGELVEIGGDFRVPDVMAQSGTALVEVGTTNRTRASDYERAITGQTRLILKVHPSNYKIVGFTLTPTIAELAVLARSRGIYLYEDAGSGALFDLSGYGLGDESVISQSLVAGADVVTFSGDKLLGASQAGLIVGKQEVIEKIRRHPLYRALRVDKLSYAVLEATLEAYRKETVAREIPALRMLSLTKEQIAERARRFIGALEHGGGAEKGFSYTIVDGVSALGGGAAPETKILTALVSVQHTEMSAAQIEQKLRAAQPPVIARVAENKILLDLRTVSENEERELISTLLNL